MARQTKVPFEGKQVNAVELGFETVREEWNEYKCEDGSTIRIKTVVSKLHRLEQKNVVTGEPIFMVRSSNIVDVVMAEGEEDVH